MSVVTTEVDASYFPGDTGTYNTIFSFPVRPGCSSLEFIFTNNGDRNCAARYHMDAGGPTTYLTSGFNNPSGGVSDLTYTTTTLGPLTTWTGCTVEYAGNIGFVGTAHLKVLQTWSGAPGSFCVYGTQLQTGAVFTQYLTPGVIDAILIGYGLGWLSPMFTALWFTYVNTQNLCSTGPPAMPAITLNSLTQSSPGEVWDALRAVMWPYFCECAAAPPGNPPPTAFPTPAPTQPVNWPTTAPQFDCDDTSLCTLLHQVMQSIAALQQTTQLDYRIDTLVQRQAVPFAYLPGTIHSALSGAGDFPVQGIIGLACTFDMIPPTISPTLGDPDTYHQLGKLTLGTADGWERSFQPTHSPYLILPVAGAVTKVGWSFATGVVATLTELLREP